MSNKKDSSLPIIGFLLHYLKLLGKTKLFNAEKKDREEQKKKEDEESEMINLNILGQIRLSKPHLLIGYILLYYKLPVLVGLSLSWMFGYYFEAYVRIIDYFGFNQVLRIFLFMVGLTPMAAIASLVAILRTFDEEYDIVGNRKYLLNANELKEVTDILAWSDSDPEVEGADWMKHLLEQLWPNVNIFLVRLISFYCPDCSLDQILGPINQIAKLEIKKVYIGDKVPKVTGIHVMNRGVKREDLIIDCEFTYDSDINIQVSGNYFIDFGINWFYFKAKTRILLTPLFQSPPVVGKIQVSFLEKPKLDWTFTGLLAVFNWDFIKRLVQCVVTYFFESPRYFTVNLAKILPVREMKLKEPIGLLRVEVMSAKRADRPDLPAVMACMPSCARQSDPYCKVKVEDQEMKTHIVRNNSNPEWYQEFIFMVHNSITDSIYMTIMDENMFTDKVIGETSITIKDFVDYKELNGRELTITLEPPKEFSGKGKKEKRQGKKPSLAFRISWFKLTTNISMLNENIRMSRAQLPVASLSVLVDSANGLDTCTAQVRSPELRPIVKISVGNQFRYTSCKRRTGFPVWEESHHFILYNPIWEMIHIEVIDMYWVEEKQLLPFIPISFSTFGGLTDTIGIADKGTVLGWYDVPTNDILISHKMKVEGSYRLNGFVENASIRLLLAIRIADFDKNVSDNMRKQRMELSKIKEEAIARKEKEDIERQEQIDHEKALKEIKEKRKALKSHKNPEEVVIKGIEKEAKKEKELEAKEDLAKSLNTTKTKEPLKVKKKSENEDRNEDFTPLAAK